MFTADFNNYFYELAEKDYAMGNNERANMPEEYYLAFGALYAAGECATANCADPDKSVTARLTF